ncbi:probable protein ABIL5 isoform X1 [Neltuma alba]|uniref:probable protein ABIL5 isoform X1 n=1 Tax=Neltuma alba TaxID=207710 RepID=UPI0010A45135|nr:probable protein ABIL5 isoform X1 [Prosopis alba]
MSSSMDAVSKPSPFETPEAEVEESINFDKSLQELRELRSQLHHAADYCETAFLKGEEKTQVVENTKGYLCRAVVTVIDHLGNVSTNLECLVSQTNAFSEAELRINSLKQRLNSCGQYADKLALTNMRWSEKLPRFHSRYLSSPPTLEKPGSERSSDFEGTVPWKIKTKNVMETNIKSESSTMVPVRDGLSVLTRVPNATFHFQSTQKVGRHRKSFHGSDILWLIRRTKRTH